MKILEVNKTPIARTYNSTAFPLSIMFAKNELLLPYVLNRYIQVQRMRYAKDYSFYDNYIAFYEWECFDFQCLRKKYFLKNHRMLNQFIQESINDNYYFYTYCDEYYFPQRYSFKTIHFIHDVLVFGYDEVNYHILGYDKNGHYGDSLIQKEVFHQAMLCDPKIATATHHDSAHFMFLLRNKIPFVETVSMKTILKSIQDYLSSDINLVRYVSSDERIFGIEAFSCLAQDIMTEDFFDVRMLRLFKEHKDIMFMRLEFLAKYDLCDDAYVNSYFHIKRRTDTIFNLYLKYDIDRHLKHLQKISEEISLILLEEIKLLTMFLNDVNHCMLPD